MRNELTKQILQNISDEKKYYLRKHADIIYRVKQLLKEKGLTQQNFAEKMGKQPSEISKWFKGEHNFTLKSITKMEAELGEDIINIPYKKQYIVADGVMASISMQVNGQAAHEPYNKGIGFEQCNFLPSKVG